MHMTFSPRRIGVLGGTFNPIHSAHLQMAVAARDLAELDAVLMMVASKPPHKSVKSDVSAKKRFAMVEHACEGLPHIYASDLELRRAGKSYTIDTFDMLRELYEDAEVHFIIGTDMLEDLPNWKNSAVLMKYAHFICVPRIDAQSDEKAIAASFAKKYSAQVTVLDTRVDCISSTQVRDRIKRALPVTALMPPSAENYTYEKGLYFSKKHAELFDRLKRVLPEKRFLHTMGVVKEAALLATIHGVDAKQARLAALLHDCGRSEDNGPLTHAKTGARLAAEIYAVTDEEVINAIRYHTTGAVGMSRLAMVIYLADMVEDGRDFPGVESLRMLAREDLYGAMHASLVHCLTHVESLGGQDAVDEESKLLLHYLEGLIAARK